MSCMLRCRLSVLRLSLNRQNLAFDKFFALNRWMMYVSPFSTQKILVVTLPKDADLFIQKSLVVSNTDIIKSRVDSNITVLL